MHKKALSENYLVSLVILFVPTIILSLLIYMKYILNADCLSQIRVMYTFDHNLDVETKIQYLPQ